MKSLQTQILAFFALLGHNLVGILAISGFFVLGAGAFSLGRTVGLFVSGGLMVLLAVILWLPDPAGRG
ncbi:hypothetical protein [Schleiferilactobacillus perolens]|uniref:hypothetical protein n=1 Tax=Schleiferilactobacillus perolens TaxID=100468 RepID=UPI00070FBB06|nr:hypothetical protein [Schleiferilactobacillus perolens]